MAAYKNQHWLPSCYMKFFSKTAVLKGRKTSVYYANSDKCESKKVEKLSCDDYHYSAKDPKGAETSWDKMENDYPIIIEKILAGDTLKTKEYYGLILTMIDFHARNPSYENLTGEENYNAFEIVSKGLMKEVFQDCNGCHNDMQKSLDFMKDNWEFQPVCSPKEELFSSDHPTLLFSIKNRLAFLFLPINPHYGIVAVDKRKIKIIGNKISDEDNGMLNAYQAYQCIEYVYSNIDLATYLGEDKPLTKWLNKPKPRGFVKNDSWTPEFIEYPNNMPAEFSFIEIVK